MDSNQTQNPSKVMDEEAEQAMNSDESRPRGGRANEIRNVLQNKLDHNLPFLPKTMKRNTPNYLRLGSNGFPVYTKSDCRNDRLFLQIGTNGDWSQ